MIHIESNEKQVTMEFGKGDVGVAGYGLDRVGIITFSNIKPREIGSYECCPDIPLNEYIEQSDVVMYFDNPRSIDVLIEALNEAKKNLLY